MTHAKIYAELGFEVHVLDQRNHGQSPHTADFSYALMADDLLAYMDEHSLASASIIGHSMGGKVAMLFACKHPKRVQRLIVVDIAPKGYPVHHQQIIAGLKSLDFEVLKSRSEAEKELAKTITDPSVRQFLLKSLYWADKGKLGLRFNLAAIEANIEMVGEELPNSAVFKGDTLFISGGQSKYILPEDEELIHHHFPLSHLYTIPEAGHWVHAEAFEAFSETSSKFLLGMFI
jgi:pimeloyl-ACP methyl ester carboxylesterase